MIPEVIRIDNPKKGIAYTLRVSSYKPEDKSKYFEELKEKKKEEDKKLRYIK